MLTTVSANDAQFDEESTSIPAKIPSYEDKQDNTKAEHSSPPEMIEFIPVVNKVESVVHSLEQEHKMEVMNRVQNDVTIREDIRKSVLAKLEKVTDFSAYYRQNINHYEKEAQKGSQYAKCILPDLYKLLSDVESKTMADNDARIPMKRAA